MIDTFISSCGTDHERVSDLYRILEAYGIHVWASNFDIKPGKLWYLEVEGALNDAQSVVVCWTQNSIKSKEVINEASAALDEDKLIPVFLEKCIIPIRFRLIQYIDLCDWDGRRDHKGIESLVGRIKELRRIRIEE